VHRAARETAFGLPVPAGHHAADLALQRMMRDHDRREQAAGHRPSREARERAIDSSRRPRD
jgi:hypothetical protein